MSVDQPSSISPIPLYAGIGSRSTPPAIQAVMEHMAWRLARNGYALRSGANHGAEAAFQKGCAKAGGPQEIWLPWLGFNGHPDTGLYPRPEHLVKAAHVHPLWQYLGTGPRRLHASRVALILGERLRRPVDFVICWTPDGFEGDVSSSSTTVQPGHAGLAIMLAANRSIPVFNLHRRSSYERLVTFLKARRQSLQTDSPSVSLRA